MILTPSSKPSKNATTVFILPKLTNESLLSVSQLCDNDCSVQFHKNNCDIIHNNKIIMKDTRNFNDSLYDIKFSSSKMPNILQKGPKLNYII